MTGKTFAMTPLTRAVPWGRIATPLSSTSQTRGPRQQSTHSSAGMRTPYHITDARFRLDHSRAPRQPPVCCAKTTTCNSSPATRSPLSTGSLQPTTRAWLRRFSPGMNIQRSYSGASLLTAAAAAAAMAGGFSSAAQQGFSAGAQQAAASSPASILIAAGIFILACATAALLLCAIPTMLAWRRTALAFESLAATLELEVPDTAATMRLSGLELADAIEEVSALSADITAGVRATGRSVAAVEIGVKNGTAMVSSGMTDYVFPAVKAQVPIMHGSLEASLQQRAKMGHTGLALRELAAASKSTAQRARVVLATVNLAGRAGLFRSLFQGRFSRGEGRGVTRQPRSNAFSSSDDAGA